MGMTRALRGTIWTAMIMTMNAVPPLKPKRATETAAKNASAIDSTTTVRTTMRLLTTSFQKKGTFIAVRKLAKVGGDGTQTGVSVRISPPGLNAVETIQ